MPRRRIYIHPIQKKYAALTILLLVLYTLFLAAALFLPLAFKLGTSVDLQDRMEAATQFIVVADRLWPAVFISIPIFVVVSLFITHRIAGPIHRLKEALKQISQGDLSSRLQFRSRDDFQELAELINEMLDQHHAVLTKINLAQDEMREALRSASSSQSDRKKMQEHFQQLGEVNKKIQELLDQFKLKT